MRIRRCITALAGAIALSVLAAMPSLAAEMCIRDRYRPVPFYGQHGGV